MAVISCVQDHTTHNHSQILSAESSLIFDSANHIGHHHSQEQESLEVTNPIHINNMILAMMVGVILWVIVLFLNFNIYPIILEYCCSYRRKKRRKRLRYDLSFSSTIGVRAPPLSL
jgi:hypothetical protein